MFLKLNLAKVVIFIPLHVYISHCSSCACGRRDQLLFLEKNSAGVEHDSGHGSNSLHVIRPPQLSNFSGLSLRALSWPNKTGCVYCFGVSVLSIFPYGMLKKKLVKTNRATE